MDKEDIYTMELVLENVSRRFQRFTAVDEISYAMGNGVYGLLGVNGAGKTTLMRMLCTLLKPTGGHVYFNGSDVFEMGAGYRQIIGYLPQEFGYYPEFSVRDYLMYIASIKGLDRFVASKKADVLLAQVGLDCVQKKKMKKLSGGMKRRVGIAQAMLNNPKILILDEPTAGLDPNERVRFRNLISALAGDRLVLLSTHIVSDVEYIANEIMLMKDGRFIQTGSLAQITAAVPEKAWSVTVSKNEAQRFLENYMVSNVRQFSGKTELRILSKEKPHVEAVPDELTLEDVFLYYFGEKGGEGNVLL